MKLIDMSLGQFNDLLASQAPAPGGGSAAALEGATGVALTHMVASLTVGKKKYAQHQAHMEELMEKTQALRERFIQVIDRDTEAFHGVSAVFAMPRETQEEKAARSAAMEEALKACTLTPHEMMVCALEGLELTKSALGKFNTSAASDLGVAALSLKAAVQGAWLNILINIGGIKDEAFARKYREEGEAILAKALPMADEIYQAVLDCL